LEPFVKLEVAPGKRFMISGRCSWKKSGAVESLGSLIKSRMTWSARNNLKKAMKYKIVRGLD